MAIYHLSAKIIGRQGGRRAETRAQSGRVRTSATNAVAAAAYRSGDELHDERTGSTYQYARAERVMHAEIVAPADAPEWARDRGQLWNSVEANERRKDAQLAREIEVALPQELNLDQQRELLRDWVSREFTSAGAVADFAIHHDSDGKNPHAHIMTTMRGIGPEGWSRQKNCANGRTDLLWPTGEPAGPRASTQPSSGLDAPSVSIIGPTPSRTRICPRIYGASRPANWGPGRGAGTGNARIPPSMGATVTVSAKLPRQSTAA